MSIEQPNEYDILCGKDKTFSKHKGNIVFREKIMSMASEYRIASTKPARMKLTKVIVDSLKAEYNAKFLRSIPISNDKYVWEEISDQQARDKTSHALRFALGKEGSSKKAASSQRQSYRRRTISSVMATSDTSIDADSKGEDVRAKSATEKRSKRVASLPTESSRKDSTFATATVNTRMQRCHRRRNSDDSSETTVVTAESDDVSTTAYLTSLGDEEDNTSQVFQNDFELLYYDNQHTLVFDGDIMSYHHPNVLVPEQRHTDAPAAAAICYHLQGVRSSPARLGSAKAPYYRQKSESSEVNAKPVAVPPIGWTIDRLDLSVRDSDLNDFLDEEITNDWENQNNESADV
jgi:hypothetical protein